MKWHIGRIFRFIVLDVIGTFLLIWLTGCTTNDVSGTGSEVEVVAYGYIADTNGKGLSGVDVALHTIKYNPVTGKNVPLSLTKSKRTTSVYKTKNGINDKRSTTDASGYFEFKDVADGGYHLYASIDEKTFVFRKVSIGQCNRRYNLDTTFTRTGSVLRIPIPESIYIPRSCLMVPGTDIIGTVLSPGITLLNVPSLDTLSLLYYDKDNDTVVTLTNKIRFWGTEGDTISLTLTKDTIFTPEIVAPLAVVKDSMVTVRVRGPFSKNNASVQSRFSWGDGVETQWLHDTVAAYNWNETGNYQLKAQTRSSVDTFVVSSWSSPVEITVVDSHVIQDPITPIGDTIGVIGTPYTFTSGGAKSNMYHPIQYRLNIKKNHLLWQDDSVFTYMWLEPGMYSVSVEGRSAIDTQVVVYSGHIIVRIIEQHTISTPRRPQGGSPIVIGTSNPFSTGGSVSDLHHPIEYRFAWSMEDTSLWLADSTVSHSWSEAGTYTIRTQARSAKDSTVESIWSEGYDVQVE